MSKYKVLWFDDEHETLEMIKEEALLKDIKLIGYKNAMEGLLTLQNNPNQFDAVLVDGLFFLKPDNTGDAVSSEAFGEVAKVLSNLKAKGIIMPWFIYSGQKSFVKEKNVIVNIFGKEAGAKGKIFDKNIDEDFKTLCSEIKMAADKQPITKARHNNPEIFKIFELGYLPESIEDNVLDLLIQPVVQNNSEFKAMLTNIRSIHESCFVKLENVKVIDSTLRNFNSKLKHLSGNPSGATNWEPVSEVYQTKAIKNLHEWIYYTCGTYIHYLEDQHYDGYMISSYAVESLRNGLLEILLWFKKTYEEHK